MQQAQILRLWKSCVSPVQRSLYPPRFFPCRAEHLSWTIGPRPRHDAKRSATPQPPSRRRRKSRGRA